jgi:hypothetical protein
LKDAIETFEDNAAPAADATMVECAAYKDDNTCCVKAFTDQFPKLLRSSFKKRLGIKPRHFGAMRKIARGIAECKGEDVAKEFLEGFKDTIGDI